MSFSSRLTIARTTPFGLIAGRKMYHTLKNVGSSDSKATPLVGRGDFVSTGLAFLDDYEQMFLALSGSVEDDEALQWLVVSMAEFRDAAMLNDRDDIHDLAAEVARFFSELHDTDTPLSEQSVSLVQAALSQMRFLLAPTDAGVEQNSIRIMTGLLQGL